MKLDVCIKKAKSYLCSDKTFPIWIDFQNVDAMNEFLNEVHGPRKNASKYCFEDQTLRFDDLLSGFCIDDYQILCGLSGFLMLEGANRIQECISTLLQQNVGNQKKIIVTLHCSDYYQILDPRQKERQILLVDGISEDHQKIILVRKEFFLSEGSHPYHGINSIGDVYASNSTGTNYILTEKRKIDFPESLIPIEEINDAYDVLCSKDSLTYKLSKIVGSPEQWNFALDLMSVRGSWIQIFDQEFGNSKSLNSEFSKYCSWDENFKWLYFIGLKLFGSQNICLNSVVDNIDFDRDLVKAVVRSPLEKDPCESDYWKFYESRLALLRNIEETKYSEMSSYVAIVETKKEAMLPYLSSLSKIEREKVIEYLDLYGSSLDLNELKRILEHVYPELVWYLSEYDLSNDFTNSYFNQYKLQKLLNHLNGDFINLVHEEAKNRSFFKLWQPRSSYLEKLDPENVSVYFMDAMGVEFLGYIHKKCEQNGLFMNAVVCRSELPSLTRFNKDFVDYFTSKNVKIKDVKDIDEIKHEGKQNFNYEKTKLPLHLISELEILDETILSVKRELNSGKISKSFLIADHGASRLAVLYEQDYELEVDSVISHGGRVCEYSDKSASLEETTVAELDDGSKFCVVAGYRRLKGGRKPSVEIHGGATLEEVGAPIIEITLKRDDIEVWAVEKNITAGFGIKAYFEIGSNTILKNVSIEIDGKMLNALENSGKTFKFEVPKSIKAGDYSAKIYEGKNLIYSGVKFTVKKKQGSERNMGL